MAITQPTVLFSASRVLPRLVMLVALLMLAGQAWGQQLMRVSLVSAGIVPADSRDVFTGDLSARGGTDIHAVGPNTENAGFLDTSLRDVNGADEGDVGVVDWILVQARVIPNGQGIPKSLPCTVRRFGVQRGLRVTRWPSHPLMNIHCKQYTRKLHPK